MLTILIDAFYFVIYIIFLSDTSDLQPSKNMVTTSKPTIHLTFLTLEEVPLIDFTGH